MQDVNAPLVRKYADWSDREMIAVLLERSEQQSRLLLGPNGVHERLTVLETKVSERLPTSRDAKVAKVGVPLAIIAAIAAALRSIFIEV